MATQDTSPIDFDTLTDQELVDYLVTASTEQDVLFVVFWLKRLRRRGVEDAVRLKATDAAHLLTLEDDEAVADWIDWHLPPPPAPDSLTGCNPLLPDQPTPTHAQQCTRPPSLSCRSEPQQVSNVLCRDDKGTAIPEPPAASPAHSVPVQSKTEHLSFPPVSLPPPSDSGSSACLGSSSSYPFASHPILLRVVDPSSAVSAVDLQQHLLELECEATVLRQNDAVQTSGRSFSVEVPSHAAWSRLDDSLFRNPLRGWALRIERETPSLNAQALTSSKVVLADTSGRGFTGKEVVHLAQAVRCGAFSCTIEKKPSTAPYATRRSTVGVFRVTSPPTAERAVKMLDGLDLGGGRRIKASWTLVKRAKVAMAPTISSSSPPSSHRPCHQASPPVLTGTSDSATRQQTGIGSSSLPLSDWSWDHGSGGLKRKPTGDAVDEFGRVKRFKEG
ncbi:hypothetical protein JCM11251_000157 [Rhodosporidiobolus azoricus]